MSLNGLYKSLGITKQGVHQWLDRHMRADEERLHLRELIVQIRDNHPTLSCRAMYYKLKPTTMGRDKFEALCAELGFKTAARANYRRTTNSNGVIRFDNLLSGLALSSINQAYSSDITYYEIDSAMYYLTFIMDCYSRRILGHSVSERLLTRQTSLPALIMAVKTRGGYLPPDIIFHSDGGGQYYDKQFLKLTEYYTFKNSMCEYAWENGKAERVNGIIKNNYLRFRSIHCLSDLIKEVDRAVTLYNIDRPHKALGYVTPVEFEEKNVNWQQQVQPQVIVKEVKA